MYSWGGAMAHVSLSFHRCEFCGAYHLMTSACFGEYFIMDPCTNTVYPFNEVFAHLVIIEDEDFNEVFAYFECIDAPNADTHSADVK